MKILGQEMKQTSIYLEVSKTQPEAIIFYMFEDNNLYIFLLKDLRKFVIIRHMIETHTQYIYIVSIAYI